MVRRRQEQDEIGTTEEAPQSAHVSLCLILCLCRDTLTVREHVHMIAVLKGTPPKDVDRCVDYCIHEVGLDAKRDVHSTALSGGMKRKLSVAMALVGDSRIIFLDEPSVAHNSRAGMDAKRLYGYCELTTVVRVSAFLFIQYERHGSVFSPQHVGDAEACQARARHRAHHALQSVHTQLLTRRPTFLVVYVRCVLMHARVRVVSLLLLQWTRRTCWATASRF